MPDVPEVVLEAAQKLADGADPNPDKDGAQPQPKVEDAPNPSPENDTTSEPEVSLPKGVSQREDGTLEFTVKTETKSGKSKESVFIGADLDELLENVRKGISEDHQYIDKLKSAQNLKTPQRSTVVNEDNAPPDREEIHEKVVKSVSKQVAQSGLAPEMLSWTNSQWTQWADDNHVNRLDLDDARSAAKEFNKYINGKVNESYADSNRDYLNRIHIDQADEVVREMIADAGIDPADYVERYEEIFHDLYADKNNFDSAGLLKDGRLVRAVQKDLAGRTNNTLKASIKAKLEADIAKSDAARKQIKPISRGAGKPTKASDNKPQTQTYEQITKELIAGLG